MPTKFFQEPVDVKEVFFNDQLEMVVMELWGINSDKIPTSGTYLIKNVKVKDYPAGVPRLSSTRDTVIVVSKKNIQEMDPPNEET